MTHSDTVKSGQSRAPGPSSWLVDSLVGAPGVMVAFIWGFAEGTFFFLVPDLLVSLVAILRPRHAWRHILAAIAGSVIAGMLLFNWSIHDARTARATVARVPFVKASMFASVEADFRKYGLGAVFLGPLSGTPYKIFAVEAPAFVGEAAFLGATAPARAERFVCVWAGFAFVGNLLRRWLRRTDAQLAIRYAIIWVIFYSFYWGMILFR